MKCRLLHLAVFMGALVWGTCSLAFEEAARRAQIVILGEVHDNPAHHKRQADWLAEIAPRAVVFEMLDAEQADIANKGWVDVEALGQALEWENSGWPTFEIYAPVFEAARSARFYGAAVPRSVARKAMKTGVVESFEGDAGRFGLSTPLTQEVQALREAYQLEAHCDALPAHLLPKMVDIQRLRDAELARVALSALDDTGGPVAVITGNGHARMDWGMAVYLRSAKPDIRIYSLGQSEGGTRPEGTFDVIRDAPVVNRPDPCAAFSK